MGHRHAWRSPDRIISSKMLLSLVYYTIVAVFVTIIGLHMTWGKHRFMTSKRLSSSEYEITGKLVARTHASEKRLFIADERTKTIQQSSHMTRKEQNSTEGGLIRLEEATKPILLIIVASSPRSGSSFLGELVSSPRRALYLFEPFWYFDWHKRRILKYRIDTGADEFVKKALPNLLECRLSELPDMFDTRLKMTIWRKPLILVPLNFRQRTAICNELNFRVIKVIRPKLAVILTLLRDPELNVHILQLVRDPRGIVNSVSDVEGWNERLDHRKACDMLRNDFVASQEYIDHPRFLRVRYEDLVARPLEEARRMFTWMGLELPAEVPRFLDLHTRQTRAAPAASATAEEQSVNGSNSSGRRTGKPVEVGKASGSTVTNGASTQAHPTADSSAAPGVTPSDQNVTSAQGMKPSEQAASPEQFQPFYGTVRDANFNGLHWIKEMNPKLRKETEEVCADVLKHYNYPLVYPQEKLLS